MGTRTPRRDLLRPVGLPLPGSSSSAEPIVFFTSHGGCASPTGGLDLGPGLRTPVEEAGALSWLDVVGATAGASPGLRDRWSPLLLPLRRPKAFSL